MISIENINGSENKVEEIPTGRAHVFIMRHLKPQYPGDRALTKSQSIDEETFKKIFLESKDTPLPPKKSYNPDLTNEDFEIAAKEGLIELDEDNKERLKKAVDLIVEEYERLHKPPLVLISSPVLRTLITTSLVKEELNNIGIEAKTIRSLDLLKEAGSWAEWRDSLDVEDKDTKAAELWFEGEGIDDNEYLIGKKTMRKRGLDSLELITRYSEKFYDGNLLAVLVTHNTFCFSLSENFSHKMPDVGECYELDLSDPDKVVFLKDGENQEVSRNDYFKA